MIIIYVQINKKNKNSKNLIAEKLSKIVQTSEGLANFISLLTKRILILFSFANWTFKRHSKTPSK